MLQLKKIPAEGKGPVKGEARTLFFLNWRAAAGSQAGTASGKLTVLGAALLAAILITSFGPNLWAAGGTATPVPTTGDQSTSGLMLIFFLAGGLVVLTIIMIVVVAAVLKKFKNWPSGR